MTLSATSLRAAHIIDRAARWSGAGLVAVFTVMVVYVVASRYLFSSTPPRFRYLWDYSTSHCR